MSQISGGEPRSLFDDRGWCSSSSLETWPLPARSSSWVCCVLGRQQGELGWKDMPGAARRQRLATSLPTRIPNGWISKRKVSEGPSRRTMVGLGLYDMGIRGPLPWLVSPKAPVNFIICSSLRPSNGLSSKKKKKNFKWPQHLRVEHF
jgi:hypothetical protein